MSDDNNKPVSEAYNNVTADADQHEPGQHEPAPLLPAQHQADLQPARLLSAQEFQQLADVPAAMVWLANIDNPNTRRAYQGDVEAFISFCGIERPDELRLVTRAHVIAWRSELEGRELAAASIRRKLSAVASLFDYLCNENAVEHNPVAGVKRPGEGANEGKRPHYPTRRPKCSYGRLLAMVSRPYGTARLSRRTCSMRCAALSLRH